MNVVSGLSQLGISLSDLQLSQLQKYRDLLLRWNKSFNLIAASTEAQIDSLHLLDSLAILPHFQASRCLDVGSGAGLPGIPLAIARPDCHFTLLDCNGKKTRFLTQVVVDLALKNVDVVNARTVEYHPTTRFDAVTTRAFAQLADILQQTAHCVTPEAVCYALKGQLPEQELAAAKAYWQQAEIEALKVPGLDALRHLILLRYKDSRS